MRRAIEYLTRLRDLSRKAAEAFDEEFPQQKSVYWRDFYAYDKAVDALMEAPQIPETRSVNLERFRSALRAAGFDQDQASKAIGALMGSMLGRKQNADNSTV